MPGNTVSAPVIGGSGWGSAHQFSRAPTPPRVPGQSPQLPGPCSRDPGPYAERAWQCRGFRVVSLPASLLPCPRPGPHTPRLAHTCPFPPCSPLLDPDSAFQSISGAILGGIVCTSLLVSCPLLFWHPTLVRSGVFHFVSCIGICKKASLYDIPLEQYPSRIRLTQHLGGCVCATYFPRQDDGE